MAGPGPLRGFRESRLIRRKRSVGRVELVDQDLVDAQVGREGKMVGWVGLDAVTEGPLLPGRMDARSVMLVDRRGRIQTAVHPDRQTGHGAAEIVGHQRHLTGTIEGDVARSRTFGRLLIEQSELAALGLNLEGADRTYVLRPEIGNFVDGVKQRPFRGEARKVGFGVFATTSGFVRLPLARSNWQKLIPASGVFV